MNDQTRHVTMRCAFTQALLFALAVLIGMAAAPIASAQSDSEQSLRELGHTLVDRAVVRPYGMAWIEEHPAEPLPPGSAIVSMDPLASPSAGLVLFYAGQILDDATLRDAAHEAGEGIVASIESSGQLPARVMYARNTAGRDAPGPVPSTAATRAGLATLLALLAEEGQDSNQLRGGARRLAGWLRAQQGEVGSWVTLWPPDAQRGDAFSRIVRLDTIDFRNTALAMLLAADILEDRPLDRSADTAVAFLIGLRVQEGDARYRHLWGTAYSPAGANWEHQMESGDTVDLLATRHAMEILLAAYLLRGDLSALAALDEAVAQLYRLRGDDGAWPRFPARPIVREGMGETEAPPQTVDLEPLIQAVGEAHKSGPVEAARILAGPISFQQRVAVVVNELEDSLLPTRTARSAKPDNVLADRVQTMWRLINELAAARRAALETAPEQGANR